MGRCKRRFGVDRRPAFVMTGDVVVQLAAGDTRHWKIR